MRYAIRRRKKGKSASAMASEPGVMPRHVRRLWAGFCRTGTPHVPRRPGRKPVQPTTDEIRMVLEEHKREPVGVLRMARRLRKDHAISYSSIYRIQ